MSLHSSLSAHSPHCPLNAAFILPCKTPNSAEETWRIWRVYKMHWTCTECPTLTLSVTGARYTRSSHFTNGIEPLSFWETESIAPTTFPSFEYYTVIELLQSKELNVMINVSAKETSTNKNEITDLKRTLQALEIDLTSQLALVWGRDLCQIA